MKILSPIILRIVMEHIWCVMERVWCECFECELRISPQKKSLQKHFDLQVTQYGQQVVINLVS